MRNETLQQLLSEISTETIQKINNHVDKWIVKMENEKRFLELVANEKTNTLAKNEARIKSRAMLRASHNIAWKVLLRMNEINCTKEVLAEEMQMTLEEVSKILSGKENLTLETIVKLEETLGVSIINNNYK